MEWKKAGTDQWVCSVPPDARFRLEAARIGDGRWGWKVFAGDAANPAATGIVNSLGSAKHAMEHYLRKAGQI